VPTFARQDASRGAFLELGGTHGCRGAGCGGAIELRPTELKWSKLQSNRLLRILVVCILAIALGVAIGEFSVTREVPIKPLFVGIVALLVLFFLSQTQSIKIFALQKFLLYLTIIAGFIGSAFLTIGVGPIHLFPYRILLPLLWLFFIIEIFLQGRVAISHIKVKPYLQFLGLWLVYGVLSLAWALSKADAIRHIVFLFMAVSVIFFAVYYFSNGKDIKRFYYLWLAVLVGFLFVGLWARLTGQHLPGSSLYGETRARFMFIPTGVSAGPNEYATFLALSLPFVLALIRYRRSIFARSVGLVVLGASLYLLLETSSRANYLAVILEFAFLFTFLFKLSTKIKTAILGGLLILALVVALPGVTQRLAGTISEELESITSPWSLTYGSTGVRINLIKNSLIFLGRTGGFGVGAGNVEYWMGNFPIYNTRGITNPHNWWDEILVDYGIFIFAGYILFYLGLIARLYKIHRHLGDGTEKMICEALLVALVGFFFASISSSSIMADKSQWFLFAFALAFLNYARSREEIRP